MEDILPFLAGLVYLAYKFYTNYQKGQQEARNRNPSKPYAEEHQDTYSEWTEPEPVYTPAPPVVEHQAPQKYHEPRYEPAYREPRVEKSVREPVYKEEVSRIPVKLELENPEIPVEEVVRNRALHMPHKQKFVVSQEEEIFYSDFDFRDAIVKEAILNRPQY